MYSPIKIYVDLHLEAVGSQPGYNLKRSSCRLDGETHAQRVAALTTIKNKIRSEHRPDEYNMISSTTNSGNYLKK